MQSKIGNSAKSIIEGIIGTILVGGVGAVFGLLKAHQASLAGPLLYGFAGAASVCFIYLTIRVAVAWRRWQSERVTPANAGEVITRWLTGIGSAVTVIPCGDDSDSVFRLRIPPDERHPVPILVAQLKRLSRYVVLESIWQVPSEQRKLILSLEKGQLQRLGRDLRMYLSRAGANFAIELPDRVAVQRRVPIAGSLTEAAFLDHIDGIASDIIMAYDTTELEIAEMTGRNATPGQSRED
jgi:hypothetical protein